MKRLDSTTMKSAKQLIEAEVGAPTAVPTNWVAVRSVAKGIPYANFLQKTTENYHVPEEAYDALTGQVEIAKASTDFSGYEHIYYSPRSWPHEAELMCSRVPLDFRPAGGGYSGSAGIRELKGEALDLAIQTLKSGEGKARFKDRSPFTHKVFRELDKMHGKPWYK